CAGPGTPAARKAGNTPSASKQRRCSLMVSSATPGPPEADREATCGSMQARDSGCRRGSLVTFGGRFGGAWDGVCEFGTTSWAETHSTPFTPALRRKPAIENGERLPAVRNARAQRQGARPRKRARLTRFEEKEFVDLARSRLRRIAR